MRLYFSILFLILTLLAGCSVFSQPLSTEQRRTVLEVKHDLTVDRSAINDPGNKSTIKVLSLNMAHGRKDSFTQFFVSEAEIRRNLTDIAEFLKREGADIVTLQEADAPSRWSGNFNHVEFLAHAAGYPWYTQATHVENWFGNYGTAVLSRLPIGRGYGYDFNPTPPTTQKGFTLAEIEWKPETGDQKKMVIDVISVHLDFSRRSKRIEQIEDMTKVLSGRTNPTIVLGDFNSGWIGGEQELQAFTEKRNLKTHRPKANYLYTYLDDRLDWILVSEEFKFCNYYTAPDILSDHLAVISELVSIDESMALAECS